MKSKVLKEMALLMEKEYGEKTAGPAIKIAQEEFDRLCEENAADPKPVKSHTEKDIFPCIALYRGLQKAGIQAETAREFLDRSWSLRAEKNIQSLRMLMKIPGLYKLYPRMFLSVAKNQFGTAAGFEAHYYDLGKDRCKFDMTRCLYCDVCRKYGCPELVPCFCHTDDVNNENLHPRLCWARTQNMGEGGCLCDFDLYIKK